MRTKRKPGYEINPQCLRLVLVPWSWFGECETRNTGSETEGKMGCFLYMYFVARLAASACIILRFPPLAFSQGRSRTVVPSTIFLRLPRKASPSQAQAYLMSDGATLYIVCIEHGYLSTFPSMPLLCLGIQ